jgi:hypothetical protein
MMRYLKTVSLMTGIALALPAFAQSDYRFDDDVAIDGNVRYDYARVVKVDAIVNRATQRVPAGQPGNLLAATHHDV